MTYPIPKIILISIVIFNIHLNKNESSISWKGNTAYSNEQLNQQFNQLTTVKMFELKCSLLILGTIFNHLTKK